MEIKKAPEEKFGRFLYGFFQWSRERDASETEYSIPFNRY